MSQFEGSSRLPSLLRWLTGWLAVWLSALLAGCLTVQHTNWLVYWLADGWYENLYEACLHLTQRTEYYNYTDTGVKKNTTIWLLILFFVCFSKSKCIISILKQIPL